MNAIADELAHESEQELLIKRTPKKSGACGQATNDAFGAPGAEPRWTHSTKEGIGTAYHTSCRLWFTISHGILNEIYYPHVDQPNTRDLQFLITIVSLDWGFNEQLAFLTNGPELYEPVWALGHSIPAGTPLVKNPSSLYLVHSHEYAVAPESTPYSYFAENGGGNAEITPYFDRQNEVAFYTIRFRPQ